MHAPDLVLFDMNDVLCRYDKAGRIAALAALTRHSAAEVEATIWGSGFEDEADAGAISAWAYLASFGRRLGFPLTLEQWTDCLADALVPIPETLELARRVSHQCHVALFTNNNLLVLQQAPVLVPEIHSIFGARFHVSAEFGFRKPDPRAYRACIETLGFSAGRTLFIDDSASNIAGAVEAGLRVHRFTDAATLADELHAQGCLPRM